VMLTFFILPVTYGSIFGEAFQSAALPCAILLTSKAVVLINSIFGWGLWAQHKDKAMLLLMTMVAIISVLLNFIFIPKMGMLAAASTNLMSEILILIGAFILGQQYNYRSSLSEN
jgi:O-antigen/teichoic acid export membrane protein